MPNGAPGDEVVVGVGTATSPLNVGGIYAYGPNGQQLWNRQTPSPPKDGQTTHRVVASPAIGHLGTGGPVLATVGTLGQAYYSVNAATGAVAPGWPYTITDSVYSSPALADVPNGSGVNAIEGGDSSPGILKDQIQGGWVRAFKANGTLSWEFHTDDVVTSSPVVGTLVPGGSPEIVVGGGDYWLRTAGLPTATSMDITALSMSGALLGREKLGGVTIDSPALADLTGNGQLDILEGTQKGSNDQVGGPGSGLMYALNPSGQALPGWPVDPVPNGFIVGQASTADLYDNGQQDVLVPTPQGLYAYSPTGQELWGVATGLGNSVGSVNGAQVVIGSAPLVTVDPNGALGITVAGFVQGTGDGIIQHYELPGGRIGAGAWPQWRHDPALTANAATPLSSVRPTSGSGIAITRLAGINRDLTSVAASQSEFPANGSARAVVLSTDANFPDALAGTPLAVAKDAPILLTSPGTLDPAVGTEIRRVLSPGKTVYILGGTGAVSQAVTAQVQALGYTVVRESGSTRFVTALAIASALGDPSTVFVADGTTFQDALVAGPAAAKKGGVVLLTNGTATPSDIAAYLAAHPGSHYAVGSAAQVADRQASAVGTSDPYTTSVDVASQFFGSAHTAGFASEVTYPDELSGGANIAAVGGPIILVPATGALPPLVSSYLTGSVITSGRLYGGTSAVDSGVEGAIAGA